MGNNVCSSFGCIRNNLLLITGRRAGDEREKVKASRMNVIQEKQSERTLDFTLSLTMHQPKSEHKRPKESKSLKWRLWAET